MKNILKQIALFVVFGAIYFLIETLWKGHLTHWTMFVVAGFVGSLIGGINEFIPWEMPFLYQCGIGMVIATVFEGISGVVLNVWLGLHIWDYSGSFMPFFYEQCCLPFALAWFGLAAVCIVLDDMIRWKFFGEEKPHYIF